MCVGGRRRAGEGRQQSQTPGCKKEVRTTTQGEDVLHQKNTDEGRKMCEGPVKGIKAEMYFEKQTGGEKTGPR